MPNILELQDDLKNFDDDQLAEAVNDPSGPVPQYLVLTEMNRRKNIRDSATMQEPQPQTTIAEELSGQMSPYGAPPPSTAPEASAGFPALANASQVTGGGAPPGFADGGIIPDPTNPFAGIAGQLSELQARNERARQNARNMAIANIGFGIAASSSPYFGQALGEGGMHGLQTYQQAQQAIDDRELDFFRSNIALAQAQQEAKTSAEKMDLERQRIALMEQEAGRAPANVRTMEWFLQQTPEVQARFSGLFGPGKSSTDTLKRLDKSSSLYEDELQNQLKPIHEGGGGFGDKLDAAAEDPVQLAKIRAQMNEAAYRAVSAKNPARREELKMIFESRRGLTADRGLNISGTATGAGDARTVPLSPTSGRARTTGQRAPDAPETAALRQYLKGTEAMPAAVPFAGAPGAEAGLRSYMGRRDMPTDPLSMALAGASTMPGAPRKKGPQPSEWRKKWAKTLNPKGRFESPEAYNQRIDEIMRKNEALFGGY